MTYREKITHALIAAKRYVAHASFGSATLLDMVGVERLRPLVLVLYAMAFTADHVGA